MSEEAIVKHEKKSLLQEVAGKFGMEPQVFLETIRKTVFPANVTPTNEQLASFLAVANEYGLNPFIRQIYAFPNKNGGIVPILAIDGWVKIANERPEYDGADIVENVDEKGNLVSVTTTIYRKDRAHATPITEWLSECKRNTDPWATMPRRMLRHKSFMQAVRYAFGIGGLYDEDEGRDIINVTSDSEILERSTAKQTERLKEKIADKKATAKPNGEAKEPGPPTTEAQSVPAQEQPIRMKPKGDIAERDAESTWTKAERQGFIDALKANNISFEQAKAQLALFGAGSTADAKYKDLEPLMAWAEKREAATL